MIAIDQITERRIIAALITEPALLAAADVVETAYFTDFRLWVVFAAIRQLQTESADVGVLEIDDIVWQRDKTYGSFLWPSCGAAFLGDLILDGAPYRSAVLWEHDIWWLGECLRIRAALEAAA